jgi:hypothetical protein
VSPNQLSLHASLTAFVLAQFYDVEFYPYTAPGVDPVFAVCGGPFVCRTLPLMLYAMYSLV